MKRRDIGFWMFLCGLLLVVSPVAAQKKIRVIGVVTDDTGMRQNGVEITDKKSGRSEGITNDDGKFSVSVAPDAVLTFSSMVCEEQDVPVDNRSEIKVVLQGKTVELGEVSIVATARNKIVPEPTDLVVEGNFIKYIVSFRVPRQMAGRHVRLVYQPVLYNVTRGTHLYGRPIVCDGKGYAVSQDRMYRFEPSQDELTDYRIDQNLKSTADLQFVRRDSLYFENKDDDFRMVFFTVLENYRKIIYRDSTEVASGTVNPLRFFRYELAPMDIADSSYLPTPELQLCEDKGEVRLNFRIGRTELEDTPVNRVEIDRFKQLLRAVEQDENLRLRSFSIAASSSPDGNYQRNLKLAQGRMQTAQRRLLEGLSPETRSFLKIDSKAVVADWEAVAALMEGAHPADAEAIREIIAAHPGNPAAQQRGIQRLKNYRTVIAGTYLPLLRRMEYTFSYSLLRFLTDAEIESLYASDYTKLSRYEFYRLIGKTDDPTRQERLCEQALSVYPQFLWAANRLAALRIKRNQPDESVLEPFLEKKVPEELIVNQIIACLKNGRFYRADSLTLCLPEGSSFQKRVEAITAAYNGRYRAAYELLDPQEKTNEVVLLLAMRRNEEAYEKARALPADEGRFLYIRAIAANRLDKFNEALVFLNQAIVLDPSLEEIARIDGDVKELLELTQ